MSLFDRPGYAYGVTVLLVGAVVWPMVQSPPVDSFPLSTFPMFSHQRPSEVDIDHLVALDRQGRAQVVPPALVAGSEVLQTHAAIGHAVRKGPRAQQQLCREVAARVAQQEVFAASQTVELRRDRYHVLGYFSGQSKPIASKRFARCTIARKAP